MTRRLPGRLLLLVLALLLRAGGGAPAALAQPENRVREALGLPTDTRSVAATLPEQELPDFVRNALAPPPGADFSAGVLQEGPIDPARYRLGPGDELLVNYRGKTSVTHRLLVLPEGGIYLPDVGTVPLAGLTLAEGRRQVRAAAQKILNNVAVDVQLARVRTFKVAIRGEVRHPGSYAVNGATRLLELIQRAGGATDSAAVRSIRLSGGGAAVAESSVDLLPFLLGQGSEAANPYLTDGVAVFVPRRQRSVVVLGSVGYPGRYDLPEAGATLGALLALVGLRPEAHADRIELLDFGAETSAEPPPARRGPLAELAPLPLHDGARILVPGRGDYRRGDVVQVEGEVRYPGAYLLGDGGVMTPADLIERAGGPTAEALVERVRLVREMTTDDQDPDWEQRTRFPEARLSATEAEWLRAGGSGRSRMVLVDLARPGGGGTSLPLKAGDRLFVPRNAGGVEVGGRVLRPGFYPFQPGAGYAKYIAAAGGPVSHADIGKTRLSTGASDAFLLAKDAPEPRPGDRIWVPERAPRNAWGILRDTVIVLGQVATIYLVIDQSTK